jgi:hypothetical protein
VSKLNVFSVVFCYFDGVTDAGNFENYGLLIIEKIPDSTF